jgi:hypothetical protein
MPAPPAKDDISGSGATPSNAQARAGFGALWDCLFGTNGLLGSTGVVADARRALGLGSAGPAGNRNLIDNRTFLINQLAKSGTVTLAAGIVGHDRWKAGAGGCSYSFAISGNDIQITIISGTLLQVIPGSAMAGGTYVASWSGTAQGRINAGAYGASGVTATGLTANTNAQVEFGTGTLTRVQFEIGDKATNYEPRLFREELAACQRFISKSYQLATGPGANTGISGGGEEAGFASGATASSIVATARFPVPMASATPTVTVYDALGNPTFATVFSGGSQFNNQPITVDGFSERGFKVFNSTNSPTRIFFHWLAVVNL